jgi:hypothetical protein
MRAYYLAAKCHSVKALLHGAVRHRRLPATVDPTFAVWRGKRHPLEVLGQGLEVTERGR